MEQVFSDYPPSKYRVGDEGFADQENNDQRDSRADPKTVVAHRHDGECVDRIFGLWPTHQSNPINHLNGDSMTVVSGEARKETLATAAGSYLRILSMLSTI